MKATLLQYRQQNLKTVKEQFMKLLAVETKDEAETTLAESIQNKLGGDITININFREEANYATVGIEQKLRYLGEYAEHKTRTFNYFKLLYSKNFPMTKQELITYLVTE